MTRTLLLIALSLTSFTMAFAGAQDNKIMEDAYEQQIYVTERVDGAAPKIDGLLDDDCWQQGTWFDRFVQQQPNEAAPPSEKTALKILYDDENLYVAIRAFDGEPDKIERRLSRRDNWGGDVVGIALDSYFDRRSAFEFDLTAAGGKLDVLHLDNWKFDFNWDAVWYGETSIDDSSWIAEMKIPFSQLRFPEKDEYVWGLHVFRWLHKNMEEDQFTLIPLSAQTMTSLFGELRGIKDIKPRRRIELLPYARSNATATGGGSGSVDVEKAAAAGLDAKIGLMSNYTVDVTVNPDFGQVESDPSVLNLTSFETFYSEKRPFFMEGSSLFDFKLGNDRVFYSRRIGEKPRYNPAADGGAYSEPIASTPILAAAKLTGKSNDGLAVGILQAVTNELQADITTGSIRSNRSVQPLTNYLVGRIQQDLNNSNTVIGGIFTSGYRDIDDDHLKFLSRSATTMGIDFKHQWQDKTYYAQLKAVGSRIEGSREAITALQTAPAHYFQRPDENELEVDPYLTSLTGYGVEIKAGKAATGHWRYSESIYARSTGFNLNDLGYIRRADGIDQESKISYVVNEPGKVLRNYTISGTQTNSWSFDGVHLTGGLKAELKANMNSLWGFSTSVTRNRYALDTHLLRGGPALYLPPSWQGNISMSSDRRKKIIFSLSGNGAVADDNSKLYHNVRPSISWRATNTLDIRTSVCMESNSDDYQYITTKQVNDNSAYLLGQLDQKSLSITFRFDYLLTRDLSIQYYASPFVSVGEYTNFKRVESAHASNEDRRYHVYSDDEMLPVDDTGILQFDENLDGSADFTIYNPDFNFGELRSNLVIRWEYKPSSTIYLVWSQSRDMYGSLEHKTLSDSLGGLGKAVHDDIFLIKFSHWFSM